MDGVSAPHFQSQSTVAAGPAAAGTATPSPEEQALKRNTDCVYFLASPLTCKKGNECEYRHSEVARVNPRDCWYWMNGNCLNPKCGFRHPPLDGLLGSQVSNTGLSSLHPAQAVGSVPAAQASYTSNKQGVPCIFFQKGLCLKGDRCHFSHGPSPASNKVSQMPVATTGSEPQSLKKAFGGLEKCAQEQKAPHKVASDSHESGAHAKPIFKVESLIKNGVFGDKSVGDRKAAPIPNLDDEFITYRPSNVVAAANGSLGSRSNRAFQANVSDDHGVVTGKDADELSREPSPGFDVLVDDQHGESDYYHDEDQFRRSGGHDGTYLNSLNEYEIGHSTEYSALADVDQDIYHDSRGYDSYERMHGQYGRENRGSSAQPERRQYPAGKGSEIDDLDLRHHLAKKRRSNGLRSVISHDYARENYAEDLNQRGPRRESRHPVAHDGSFSSRLQGRIKMPGRLSSPVHESDLQADRELNRGRSQSRLSPGRQKIPLYQGRLRDRITGRIQEDLNNDFRYAKGLQQRRDVIHDVNTDFEGPKSLAELKVGKNADIHEQPKDQQSAFGKRKLPRFEEQSECDLSFEGPKSLSEILKRKRGADVIASHCGLASDDKSDKKKIKSSIQSTDTSETQAIASSEFKEASRLILRNNTEKPTDGQSSLQDDLNELETEDQMLADDVIEHPEGEAYDDRDGDFDDYEHVEGEEYNLDDGENAEDEFLEDDDEEFAKKMGVVYS